MTVTPVSAVDLCPAGFRIWRATRICRSGQLLCCRSRFGGYQSRSRVPVTASSVNFPRSNTYASITPTYQQQESRTAYYSGPPPPVTQAQQVYALPQVPYYGHAVPVTVASYDTQDAYDSRSYQDPGYSQAPSASSSSIPATSNTSSRLERERESVTAAAARLLFSDFAMENLRTSSACIVWRFPISYFLGVLILDCSTGQVLIHGTRPGQSGLEPEGLESLLEDTLKVVEADGAENDKNQADELERVKKEAAEEAKN